MTTESEIRGRMEQVLDDSRWDDLLIEFSNSGTSVEFADFADGDILYNIAGLPDGTVKDQLERQIEMKKVSRGDIHLTLEHSVGEEVSVYLEKLRVIFDCLDEDLDSISELELRDLE